MVRILAGFKYGKSVCELFKNHQNMSIWDEIDNFEALKIPEVDEE